MSLLRKRTPPTWEDFDPAALPWSEWADGRPRRLKRGKHYVGEARPVQRAARAAAAEMDMAVVTTNESLAKWEYVWFQFADQSVEEGDPCRCGGRTFVRHHVLLGRCEVCRRSTVLLEPKEPIDAPTGSTAPVVATPEDPEFGRVTAVRLTSPEGREVTEVPIDTEAVVVGAFESPLDGLYALPQVIVRTSVIRVFVAAPPRYRQLERAGAYRIEMRIPPHLLAPQAYTVELRVRVMSGDRKRLLPGLQIPFTAVDPSGRIRRREGVVRPQVEWAMRDAHGLEPPEHRWEQDEEPLDPDDGVPGG